MNKIRLGIVGYGNVGKGVEYAINQNSDMELVAIFTRRNPKEILPVSKNIPVCNVEEAENFRDTIDVMILCGGSATDLMVQAPQFAKQFNCVDSFDTHARIPEYFDTVNECANSAKKVSIISTGWDPGLFSLLRVLGMAFIPNGKDYTFWGKGVSQGHSDAIRQISGVKYAVQYTIPIENALELVRNGENTTLTPRQKHIRECFVVAEHNADLKVIEQTIQTMPYYFSDYDTTVFFISDEEYKDKHLKMPHGGFVFRTGKSGNADEHHQRMEFSLQLESNPEFTASIMVAYSRAAYRLYQKGETGVKTVLDVPIGLLVSESMQELRKKVL